MANNYFAVSRSLIESDEWLSEPFTRSQAWVDLIGLARWKAGHARVKGTRINLERGQLCWSEVKLSERWKWSRGKVRRFLQELENDQQIVQQKSPVTSVISLVNYHHHQPNSTADGTAGEQPKTAVSESSCEDHFRNGTADNTGHVELSDANYRGQMDSGDGRGTSGRTTNGQQTDSKRTTDEQQAVHERKSIRRSRM